MANQLSTSPAAAFGEATRLVELRRRFFFLIGGLIVYRIGTFIPVPGIDPTALARFFAAAAGHDPEHVQHVLGRCAAAAVDLRARRHAVHLGVDHRADDGRRRAAVAGAAQGRRVRPPQAHAVHALWHGRAGAVPGRRCRGRVPEPGRGPQPGLGDVRAAGHVHAGRGHDVPDVARRADHRARSRQRHLDDHPVRHPRRAAGRDRRHARAGPQRRDQPDLRADPDRDGRRA